MTAERTVGDLAIVLHSHMPYVEGFGTYPFGEEWLFDAVIRSYLPLLEVARDLTLTVTPVLADQLEDARCGAAAARVPARVADRRRRGRPRARSPPSAGRPARASWRATGARWSCSTRPAATRWRRSAAPRRRGGWRSPPPRPPTRCCRCWRPAPGLRLQLDAGIRSHRRRFGWDGGFWLPECAYAPGPRVAPRRARGRAGSASTRAPTSRAARGARARSRTEAGPGGAADRLGGDRLALGARRLPLRPRLRPVRRQIAARACGSGGSAAAPTTRPRRRGGRAEQGREFLAAVAARLRAYAAERGRRGLLVFAIDTELLGHWWSEGPIWLAAVLEGAAGAGVRLVTVPQALAEHEPERRPLAASSWGEGKDLRTWDSPPVADLAWGARRLELRLLRALAGGLRGAPRRRAPRASCSPRRRATGPSSTGAARRATTPTSAPPTTPGPLLEAIDSRSDTDPRMRSLAPDLSIAAAARALNPHPDDPRPDPLLGVPAADRGRARPPRPQALRGAGRPRGRGPRPHPRRRGVAGRGERRRRRRSTASASRSARPTWASSSPGSSG